MKHLLMATTIFLAGCTTPANIPVAPPQPSVRAIAEGTLKVSWGEIPYVRITDDATNNHFICFAVKDFTCVKSQ